GPGASGKTMTTTLKTAAIITALLGGLVLVPRAQQTAPEDPLAGLVQRYLWAASDGDRREAETALTADASLAAMSRERFHDLEEAMRRGRASYPPTPARGAGGRFPVVEFSVDVPAGPL